MLQEKQALPMSLQGEQSSVRIGETRVIHISETRSRPMEDPEAEGDRSRFFKLNGRKGKISTLDVASKRICIILFDEETGEETDEIICNIHTRETRALSLRESERRTS